MGHSPLHWCHPGGRGSGAESGHTPKPFSPTQPPPHSLGSTLLVQSSPHPPPQATPKSCPLWAAPFGLAHQGEGVALRVKLPCPPGQRQWYDPFAGWWGSPLTPLTGVWGEGRAEVRPLTLRSEGLDL
ncbi:hypothetical protein KIL84_001671 [Mauremys mutica]|uniref:Uncharacterized protein n=1 Tax=Mauremys mutica TaxID=74926 RepID=A0A9D3XJC9_9SAUR|nr:hypothetical protein KIL84_001671 [Mauremys mutica]